MDVSFVPVVTLAVEAVVGSLKVDVAPDLVLVLSVDIAVEVLAVVNFVDPEVNSTVFSLVADSSKSYRMFVRCATRNVRYRFSPYMFIKHLRMNTSLVNKCSSTKATCFPSAGSARFQA